jgi:hypothetical protein
MHTKRFLSVALLLPGFGLAVAAAADDDDSFSARLRGPKRGASGSYRGERFFLRDAQFRRLDPLLQGDL